MQFLAYALFFTISIVQLAAIYSGFVEWMDLPSIVALVLSAITTFIPVLGLIAGVGGAVTAWDWPVWQAVLLFIWPLVMMLILSGGETVLEIFRRR